MVIKAQLFDTLKKIVPKAELLSGLEKLGFRHFLFAFSKSRALGLGNG